MVGASLTDASNKPSRGRLTIPRAGGYLALSEPEAQTIAGHVSLDGSSYFVVPHVRHSLHCVNYLRKVAYDKYYPTVRTENKPTVPTFWMHVGTSSSRVSSSQSRPLRTPFGSS